MEILYYMKINVVIKNKKVIEIEFEKTDTIRMVFEKIKQKTGETFSLLNISGEGVSERDFNKTLEDFDLEDGYNILISEYYNGGGFDPIGMGIDMADISNKKGLIRGNYDTNAPKWRKAEKGLNILGICKNNCCEAYNEAVICRIGMGEFDLVGDADEIKCPICFNEINPITCVFCECQYKFEGKKKLVVKLKKLFLIGIELKKIMNFMSLKKVE